MATPNKQRILAKLFTQLGKQYQDSLPKGLTVLDHLLLGVVQEGASFSQAYAAHQRLLAGFHDLNELRVSHPKELEEFLVDVPDCEAKARRILSILQFVYETTYAFDLESMKRKPLKQAQKQLSKITGTTAFTVAATVQRALGGHSLPLDAKTCEMLVRLTLIDPNDSAEQIRTSMEHLVPKAKGISFSILLSEFAADAGKHEELLEVLLPKSKQRAGKIEAAASDDESVEEVDMAEPAVVSMPPVGGEVKVSAKRAAKDKR